MEGIGELVVGVGPSGLTDLSEIKVAICYLLNYCDEPLNKEQIFDILDVNKIVNYFYFSQALEELVKTGQLKQIDGCYIPEKEGIESANTLQEALAKNIRLLLANSAKNYGERVCFEKWHNVKIQKLELGYMITCEIADESMKLMSVSLFVPGREQLDAVQERFEANSEEIYKTIASLLTGEILG
jgi:hypothetical protein